MVRFFGLMPSSCVKKQTVFVDEYGEKIIIQAGDEGWSIIYQNGASQYKDFEASTIENFNYAYEIVKSKFNNLTVKDGYCIER